MRTNEPCACTKCFSITGVHGYGSSGIGPCGKVFTNAVVYDSFETSLR